MIIGGIKRIAHVAEAIVPLMCFVYVIACLYILFANFNLIPEAFGTIFASAFSFKAGAGGAAGTLIKSMVNGIKRAVFSNEAGIGSAAIAHSAAKTKYPVREGLVALLEPFIDTVVICTMTALVIVITGAYANPEFASLGGAALTSRAFGEEISWFPIILGLSVVLFAYSTMISWSYYGERCWSYLFGEKTNMLYRFIFLGAAFGGSVMSSQNILDFSDLMILGMAVPNILGLYFMSGKIKGSLDDYWNRYTSGAFDKKKLRKLKAQEST